MAKDIRLYGFSSGEWSSSLALRSDVDAYSRACTKLVNFDVDPLGCISRRNGLELYDHMASPITATGFVNVVPFLFDEEEQYAVIFQASHTSNALCIDIYDIRAKQLVNAGKGTDISGVNISSDFASLRVKQYLNEMYICHPSMPVHRLIRELQDDGTYVFRTERFEFRAEPKGNLVSQEDGLIYTLRRTLPPADAWESGVAYEQGVTVSHNVERLNGNDLLYLVPGYGAVKTVSLSVETVTQFRSFNIVCTVDVLGSAPAGACNVFFPAGAIGPTTFRYTYTTPPGSIIRHTGLLERISSIPYTDYGYQTTDVLQAGSVEGTITEVSDGVYRVSAVIGNITLTPSYEGTSFIMSVPEIVSSGVYSTIDQLPASPPSPSIALYRESVALTSYTSTASNNTSEPGVGEMDKWRVSDYSECALSCSAAVFSADDIGEMFIFEPDAQASLSGSWGPDSQGVRSGVIPADGKVKLTTQGGRWAGELSVEISYDNGKTWTELTSVIGADDGSVNPSTEKAVDAYGALVRVYMKERKTAVYKGINANTEIKTITADFDCKWSLICTEPHKYHCRVTEFVSESTVHVQVAENYALPSDDVLSGGTCYRSAWGRNSGYPCTVEIAQGRLWFMGNNSFPKTIWGSETNNIDVFAEGSDSKSAVSFEASSSMYDSPQWLNWGKDAFQVGSSLSEMTVHGSSSKAITATSIDISHESAWGSANVDCVRMGDMLFYVKSGGMILQSQFYDFSRDRYLSGEMNKFAKHLFGRERKIEKIAYVRNPYNSIYVLVSDGTLAKMTYDEEQKIVAWSRIELGGGIKAKSMCVCVGDEVDKLLLVVDVAGTGRLGEINPIGDVWTDAGNSYTAEVETFPLDLGGGFFNGGRAIISALDVYGEGVCGYDVSFDGGETWQTQDAQFLVDGTYNMISGRAECNFNGDYDESARVSLRTTSDAPLKLFGFGVDLRRIK